MTDWLTYQQLGARFGLGTEAARTRVRRLGWRTQPGNDGRTLVAVPEDADLRPAGAHAVRPPGAQADTEADDRDETALTDRMTGLMAGALAALEGAVTTLTEQLQAAEHGRTVERERADRAEGRADRADTRADDLRGRVEALQSELATATASADAARADRQQAVQTADALRAADAERQAQGRWARAWQAWRGR